RFLSFLPFSSPYLAFPSTSWRPPWQVGKLVRLLGAAVELEDGGRRVPLAPRGWIDADALEPVQADGLGGGAPARPGSPLGGAPGGAPARPGSPP
ncbi:unnamed protein product, partial [Prorocentrum cordatum]